MPEIKQKRRIGIVRGGDVDDYERSLKDGGDIFLCIHENLSDQWKPVDILIDRNGLWHVDGIPIQEKTDLINKVDAVWNATHPSFSQIFETLKIPYFGVDSFSHAISENRNMLREYMKGKNILMSRHVLIPAYQPDFDGPIERYPIKKAKEVFEKFGAPWIIRPVTPDPNMPVYIANIFSELVDAIADVTNHKKSILVEEFITGKEAEVHAISGFRGKDIYTFPCLSGRQAFGIFPDKEKEEINSLAQEIFKQMGVSHYLKVNFKVNKRGKIYLTDVNLLPSFDKESHLTTSGEGVGAKTHHIVGHILEKIFV